MESSLQFNPKSKIVEHGYINVYSILNPKERRQLEYKRQYKKANQQWDETQEYLSKQFDKLCHINCIVLDAGCGNGNYIIDENRNNIKWAVGVDVSISATGKNICLDEIIETSLENLPFPDNTFDCVLSLWVFEHLENPQKVLDEIHRVLKPGGLLMFATPNKDYFLLKISSLINNSKIINNIVDSFYGRKPEDVFPTFYRANRLDDLKLLAKNYDNVELRLNFDPSYTSFNEWIYKLTCLSAKILPKLTHSHIIGLLRKK